MKLDINKMVSNFLSWKLPNDFSPNGFIEFKDANIKSNSALWPTGINLLYAPQAKEMIEAMLVDAVVAEGTELVAFRRLYEGDVSDENQWLYADEFESKDDNPNWEPLFTAPPQLAERVKALESQLKQLDIEFDQRDDIRIRQLADQSAELERFIRLANTGRSKVGELEAEIADQAATILQLEEDNAKLRDALEWALKCIDVGRWIEQGDMKIAVNAYNKAKQALGKD